MRKKNLKKKSKKREEKKQEIKCLNAIKATKLSSRKAMDTNEERKRERKKKRKEERGKVIRVREREKKSGERVLDKQGGARASLSYA